MSRPATIDARNLAVTLLVGGTLLAADPGGWFAFAPIKWAVVTTLTLAVLALTTWQRAWVRPEPRVAAIIGVFICWLGLCAVLGADPRYAWLGTPERHAGWLMWALCAALFLCALPLQPIVDGVVLAGVGLVPVLLFDAASHPLVASGTQRLTGTFGSAAYLGAACTVIAPVAFGVAADVGASPWRRRTGWIAAASGVFGIAGSGTRGAWVAAVVVGGAWGWRNRRSSQLPRILGCTAAAVLLAALMTPVAQRASSVADDRAGGGATRFDEWRVATAVIGEHPVFGSGPEGYRVTFRDGVDAEYERAFGRDPQPDRAHNGFLDIAAIGGLPAAALFAGLISVVAITIRQRRRAAWRATSLGAAIAVVTYLAQQQFLFPLAEVEPVVWMLAGALAAPARREPGSHTGIHSDAVGRRPATPPRTLFAVATTAIVAAAALGSAWWGARDVRADRAAAAAVAAPDRAAGIVAARKAVALRGDQVRLWLLLARVTTDPAEQQAAFDRAAQWSPDDPILLGRQAEFLSATDPAAAVDRLTDLVRLDPFNAQLHNLLGTAFARTDQLDAAERAWLVALDLAPGAPGPRRNLITLYRQQGRTADADKLEQTGNQ